MRSLVILLALAVPLVLLPSTPVYSDVRTLTIEERIEAQRAIEEVYWRHRTWPEANAAPKPPLSAVITDATLRSRVEGYLRKSNALAAVWGRPITSKQLQAEMERMARESKSPDVLTELFAALGNEPALIAETLVRQKLVERRFREADLSRGKGLLRTPSLDAWSSLEREKHGTALTEDPGAYELVRPSGIGCANDTWRKTFDGDIPDARYESTAVWTGTEMIVWGGWRNSLPLSGNRYDPATDTWTLTSMGTGVPSGRYRHTAVWTGTEMIVWGGTDDVSVFNSGGRYDPLTDTWAETSTSAGVPSARAAHTAVWTGTEMIVWGGAGDSYFNTGARYVPSTDTWAPISTGANVPQPRGWHTAVWTGTTMIIWGGYDDASVFLTGGRYDPSTDTWSSTSTNAPSGRMLHTAVWTGTEMIVWGGLGPGGATPTVGGRYDPTTDTWIATSTGTGTPSGRTFHTAVWTGTDMVIWGGAGFGENPVNTGSRYDPSTNTWTPTSTTAAVPSSRQWHNAVWTGTEMIVWGGGFNTGGRYDPSTDVWRATSEGANVPSNRSGHTAVWTGSEMIIWGGTVDPGARYDPSTDTWAATSTGANVPSSRVYQTAVWTGTEMIVWGGTINDEGPHFNTGSRYDPSTDTWAATSTGPGVASPRIHHTAVWTGSKMIIWGGTANNGATKLNTGGRYDPSTNTWAATSTGANVPPNRRYHTAVWTGTQMIVWGGEGASRLNSGRRYDPSTDTWTATSIGAGVPTARIFHTAVWTGTEMIVWGGDTGILPLPSANTGGRYNPATNTWTPTSTGAGVPLGRISHTAVWNGTEMIVWGGNVEGAPSSFNTGARYHPFTNTWLATSTGTDVPAGRSLHTAVWTGSEMIVWGGDFTSTGGRYCASTRCTGSPSVCDDDNVCTVDACAGTGFCSNTPVSCDDGDACTLDTCESGSGECLSTEISCDDGNPCNGSETCNPAGGACVPGAPLVCAPPGTCQAGPGTCDACTGLCVYPTLTDGTMCDDGDASTGEDACRYGACIGSGNTDTMDPKSKGYWRRICTPGPHSGSQITDADAVCIGDLTSTFAGYTSRNQVCTILDAAHGCQNDLNRTPCSEAEDQLIALALNVCKQHLRPEDGLDSRCTGVRTTVGYALASADALLSDPSRTNATCQAAGCLATEINNGFALELVSLVVMREGVDIRLDWTAPVLDDGTGAPNGYAVWRRPSGSLAPFVQIGSTAMVTYLDVASGAGSWDYYVTGVYP